MKVYVVRHGETNYNVLKLANDDKEVDVHLTLNGITQAERIKDKLKDIKFDIVYTSELHRTIHTARIICPETLKITAKELNDRKTGFESRPTADFRDALAKANNDHNAKFYNGESFNEEIRRVKKFIEHLKRMKTYEEYENVLIITHDEPMKIIEGLMKGLSNEEMWEFRVYNCDMLVYNI